MSVTYNRGISKPMLNVLSAMADEPERRWKTTALVKNQYSLGFTHEALSDCVRFGLAKKVDQGTWTITARGCTLIKVLETE